MGVDNTKPILNKIKRLEKIKFYHNKLKIFMKIICMKIILSQRGNGDFLENLIKITMKQIIIIIIIIIIMRQKW